MFSLEKEGEWARVFHFVFFAFEVVASIESNRVARLVRWVILSPFGLQFDVIFGSLMAEQEPIITVEARYSFRSRDKGSDKVFFATEFFWCIPAVDFMISLSPTKAASQ